MATIKESKAESHSYNLSIRPCNWIGLAGWSISRAVKWNDEGIDPEMCVHSSGGGWLMGIRWWLKDKTRMNERRIEIMRTKEQSIHGGQMLSSRLLYFIIITIIDGSIYRRSDPILTWINRRNGLFPFLFLSCCGSRCQTGEESDSDHHPPLTLLLCLSGWGEGKVRSILNWLLTREWSLNCLGFGLSFLIKFMGSTSSWLWTGW